MIVFHRGGSGAIFHQTLRVKETEYCCYGRENNEFLHDLRKADINIGHGPYVPRAIEIYKKESNCV